MGGKGVSDEGEGATLASSGSPAAVHGTRGREGTREICESGRFKPPSQGVEEVGK